MYGKHHQGALHRSKTSEPAVAAFQFLHDESVGYVVEPCASVPFQVRSQDTQLRQLRDQMDRESGFLAVVFNDRNDPIRNIIADGVPYHLLFFAEQIVCVIEVQSLKHSLLLCDGSGVWGYTPTRTL